MTRDELLREHPIYKKKIDDWNFWGLAYEGGMPFIKHVLKQNSRESFANWKNRVDEGCNFNYTTSIVDLFNFYLTEKPVTRVLGGLEDDPLWQAFFKDCDHNGTNFDLYINEIQKLVSVYECVGILVNKAGSDVPMQRMSDEIESQNYPYVSTYTPPNILDWGYAKNKFGTRKELEYVKLVEDDGSILIYHKDWWQIWVVNERGYQVGGVFEEVSLIDQGVNALGIVPFFWSYNMKSPSNKHMGISDIKEISLITASICRNISSGDETIKFTGFPMFRTPMQREGIAQAGGGDVLVAPHGVLEFDPEHGSEGKPDWLESEVLEPIEAVLNWTDRKADEIYRIAHLSGVHGQRKSNNEVASGLALRYEFQQLNSVLIQKSNQAVETELNVIKLWLLWQNKTELFDSIEVNRNKQFSMEDLSINLDNSKKAMDFVRSNHFNKLIQYSITRQMLPDISDADEKIIKSEIETNIVEVDEEEIKTEETDVQLV